MPSEEHWQRARLFPVTGIGNPDEQERRGASVFLAVLAAVKEFGRTLTQRCDAPSGIIETFIEVPFDGAKGTNGKPCRPDGLIRVTRGQRSWTALVEVKTGRNDLEVDQLHTYLDVARENGFDALITISHQVATTPGVHPVSVDGRKTKKVKLIHLSWSRIHTEALIQRANHEVRDPDQAWILSEFIRYIETDKSGALDFDDMGSSWVPVRNAAANSTLRAGDPGTLSVVARFDQLLAFCGMELSRQLGVHVSQRLSRAELDDPGARVQRQAIELAKGGLLTGALLVPNAAAPVEITVDLKANRVDASATIAAPTDRRARARVTWLVAQLKAAPPNLRVMANVARARVDPPIFELATLIEDPKLIVNAPGEDIRSFTLTLSQPAGSKRGKVKGSFVRSVTGVVDSFYAQVVQPIKPWTPRAPKPKAAISEEDAGQDEHLTHAPTVIESPTSATEAIGDPEHLIKVEGLAAPANSTDIASLTKSSFRSPESAQPPAEQTNPTDNSSPRW